MPYLLNLVYVALLIVVSPWLAWQAVRKGKYRAGFGEKLLGRVPRRESTGPCVWLHAVSVGEVNLLPRLIEDLRRLDSAIECVISTTTRTGMELAQKKFAGHTVFFCPLDFTWAVREAMRRIRPDAMVLAELELWPNLIRAAGESGAAVAVVNGRLGEKSFRGYLRLRRLLARVLRRIDLIAAQDATYAQRFAILGARPEAVQVTGSMKYDGAQTDRNNPATRRLAELAGFKPDDVVFLAGSTQEPEEQMALDAFRRLTPAWPALRLVLVPRHPERFGAVARLLDASGVPWQRRTALDREAARPNARVLLVDVVGELGAWWGTSRIAFVGGSFGDRGGQNMIEPAAYGSAVSFGPNTWNFQDIVSTLLAQDAAVVLPQKADLEAFVLRCLQQPDWADALGRRAAALVADQLGATGRTARMLVDLLQCRSSERRSQKCSTSG